MVADNGQRSSCEIRPARVDDAGRVFEMLTEFVTSYRPDRQAFDVNFPALVASPDADLLVADDNGYLLGYALALRVPTLFANGDLWDLQELFVDANCRSHGLVRNFCRKLSRMRMHTTPSRLPSSHVEPAPTILSTVLRKALRTTS